MENGTPDLPQDIITSILVRLSVKSLIRFQCVCKDWKNMFKTQSFIAKHLHHSTLQNSLIIADNIISEGNGWHLRLLNREMQVFEFHNTDIIDPLMPGWVYSSNGLLCVDLRGKSQDSLWLWNPAIRVVRQLPKSFNHFEYEYFSVGFGFSPIVNDYRIVKLFFSGGFVVQGKVYSLRMGLWRKVEVGNLEGVYGLRLRAFPCNGDIFWIGHKEDMEKHSKNCLDLIVSFDIAKEVFTLIPFPTRTSAYGSFNTLASYESKLAIFFGTDIENSESYVIDMWVLEECAYPSRERWSWAKIYTSRPNLFPSFIIWPKIIYRNEIVCLLEELPRYQIQGEEESYKGKFILCNLTTDEFKLFDIPIWSWSLGIFHYFSLAILDYVESLVLLDNFHI
ncbi:hypothetical protein K1719_033368 [Acacia pycnantha]|nr:hypothetical protein K1719_033368 [Acacia pycnantha]